MYRNTFCKGKKKLALPSQDMLQFWSYTRKPRRLFAMSHAETKRHRTLGWRFVPVLVVSALNAVVGWLARGLQ